MDEEADKLRREGRGQLSSIEMLPEDADNDIHWAHEQLRLRKLPQTVIFAEFNERLADKGITPISKSAWSRYAVRRAILWRRHDELRHISTEAVSLLGIEGADEVTVMIAEMLKVAIYEKLEHGELSDKAISNLSTGLSRIVNAQRASAKHKEELRELDDRLKKAAEVVANVGKKNGVSAETLAEINRALGVQA